MERAKNLLESSFLSVKEIAFQVGLNDESHFVRDFKSTYGYSPALYRSHFKNNGNGKSNGHGEVKESQNGSNANQSANLGQQLANAAKQSILPSLHVLIYMFSYLN